MKMNNIYDLLCCESGLNNRGTIDEDTKFLLKDMILSGMPLMDNKLHSALDEYEVSGDTAKLEVLIQSGRCVC